MARERQLLWPSVGQDRQMRVTTMIILLLLTCMPPAANDKIALGYGAHALFLGIVDQAHASMGYGEERKSGIANCGKLQSAPEGIQYWTGFGT